MDIIFAVIFICVLLAICVAVIAVPKWIKSVVSATVKYDYDVLIEDMKLDNQRQLEKEREAREIRLKAALISELLAEWVTRNQDRKKLRQLTIEAFIWLPEELANDLSEILSHGDKAIGIREFIILVRKHLGVAGDLDCNKIITFPLTKKEKSYTNDEIN